MIDSGCISALWGWLSFQCLMKWLLYVLILLQLCCIIERSFLSIDTTYIASIKKYALTPFIKIFVPILDLFHLILHFFNFIIICLHSCDFIRFDIFILRILQTDTIMLLVQGIDMKKWSIVIKLWSILKWDWGNEPILNLRILGFIVMLGCWHRWIIRLIYLSLIQSRVHGTLFYDLDFLEIERITFEIRLNLL